MLSDLQALYGGIEYLRGLAGPRHLIFISEAGVSPPRYEDDRALARRAADARVSLDFIHGRSPNMFTVQTSNYVTKLTGGQFFASQFKNDSEQIDRIELATRFQYMLGYSPPRPPIDGKYRRLEVRVNRPGVTVLTRDGYLARPAVTPLERKSGLIFSRVASAAEYQFPVTDLSVTAAAGPPRPRVFPVTITIDLSRVAFDRQGSRNVASIEVAVFVVTKGEDDAGHSWQTLELNYSDERLAQVRAAGLRHDVTVTTTRAPGAAKVVVYDYNSDLLGTAVVRVPK
jgi:hypothetical protein